MCFSFEAEDASSSSPEGTVGVHATDARYSSSSPRDFAVPRRADPQSTSVHVVGKNSGSPLTSAARLVVHSRVWKSFVGTSVNDDTSTTPSVTRAFSHPACGYECLSSGAGADDEAASSDEERSSSSSPWLSAYPRVTSTTSTWDESTRVNAIAPLSGRHQKPRSRRISSAATNSARPCVTNGRPRAPCVTRNSAGEFSKRTSHGATLISERRTNATQRPSGDMLASRTGASREARATHRGYETRVVGKRARSWLVFSTSFFFFFSLGDFCTSTTYAPSGRGTSNREGLVASDAHSYRVTPTPPACSRETSVPPAPRAETGVLDGSKHACLVPDATSSTTSVHVVHADAGSWGRCACRYATCSLSGLNSNPLGSSAPGGGPTTSSSVSADISLWSSGPAWLGAGKLSRAPMSSPIVPGVRSRRRLARPSATFSSESGLALLPGPAPIVQAARARHSASLGGSHHSEPREPVRASEQVSEVPTSAFHEK